jgi:pimeloyl-ACP methyl ester carboxylesterase
VPITQIDGVRISYEITGTGRPLVFLHCWTGNRSFYFEQVRRFSSEYACICPDFPGHGGSGPCDEYSIARFSELLYALMKELGVMGAVFAGHSLGGMVAMQLALEHPEMVEGLVLLDTTPHLCGFLAQRVATVPVVVFGRLATWPAKALAAGIVATHPLASPSSRIITGLQCARVANVPMVRTMKGIRDFDASGRLGEIEAPVLIVVGDADMLADVRHARLMARNLPNSTMRVVRGAGHMALFEKPEVVNRAIADFLNRYYRPGIE